MTRSHAESDAESETAPAAGSTGPGDDSAARGAADARGDAVARFVERFALLLTEAGWPRTPARVFACLLADDGGRLTARELSTRLQISPAAVSGGVRYLAQVHLVVRERDPGARRDHYRCADDVWTRSFQQQTAQLKRWEEGLAEGVALVGPDTPAGRRLDDSRALFRFMQDELPAMLQRWQEQHRPAT
ncbi:MAG: MarR family transcriptional regulator [Acidimicrobiales bacterium]|nr:MarR family transcriptional regulator [Acidimicrobiales bacterium]